MQLDAVRLAVAAAPEANPEPPRPLMRELPPADPFPVYALGPVLASAAHAIHDRVQAPLAISGQSVLAAATLAVQAHADVQLPNGQSRPLTNFFFTIAATGERKTAVDAEALSPVRKREAKLREAHQEQQPDYLNAQLAWDKAREKAIQNAKGNRDQIKAALDALGSAPLPLLEPLLTCAEPTYEGLCKSLTVGCASQGIFAAEGGQFIGGHGMSDDAKLRTATGLSAIWDGEPIKRLRADRTTTLPGRRVAMHLMAQPDVASLMLDDPLLASQGLLSRFLASAPNPVSGSRLWHDPAPKSLRRIQRYDAHLLDIMERPLPLIEGTQNVLCPRVLPLARKARELWIGFYNHIEKQVGTGGELEAIRGLANKLPEHAARIAAVLTMVSDIEAAEVTAAKMEAGIQLAQHYACEALRLFGASRVSAQIREAQMLLRWIASWEQSIISLPDIYQLGPNCFREKASAARAVQVLEDHGYLAREGQGAVIHGKYRRDVWRIVRV
jgi:hypothetical protein